MSYKNLTKEDLRIIEAVKHFYKQDKNEEMSQDRATDLLEIVDVIIGIFENGFICSKCGNNHCIYQVRP